MSEQDNQVLTMNMPTYTIGEFLDELRFMMGDPEQKEYIDTRPMLALGKAGIGKTESIKSLAEELGIGYKELRLNNLGEADLQGIPVVDKLDDGTLQAKFAASNLLPVASKDKEVGILAIDEFTTAKTNIRGLALQLLDSSRGINDYKLPEHWKVVAMGNGANDGGIFMGLENNIINRCYSCRVEPDLPTWKKWALSAGVHDLVIAYLSKTDSLYIQNTDEGSMPTPRSWKATSDLLRRTERYVGKSLPCKEVPESLLYTRIACCIGMTEATLFAQFINNSQLTVDAEAILRGESVSFDFSNASMEAIYLMYQNLISCLYRFVKNVEKNNPNLYDPILKTFDISDNHECAEKTANVMNFLMQSAYSNVNTKDVVVRVVRDIIASIKGIDAVLISSDNGFAEMCPLYTKFANEHSQLFTV